MRIELFVILGNFTGSYNQLVIKKFSFQDSIIDKNNKRLPNSGGSIYLKNHPVLTPLLDTQSNEY